MNAPVFAVWPAPGDDPLDGPAPNALQVLPAAPLFDEVAALHPGAFIQPPPITDPALIESETSA